MYNVKSRYRPPQSRTFDLAAGDPNYISLEVYILLLEFSNVS